VTHTKELCWENLVWLIQKIFVGKLSHLTMSVRKARYQKCRKILKFSQSKFEALIPLPLHTTPPSQKGPKRLTQGPSSPKKNKRNKTHMKSSNKWGNFPLPWKVLERDP
jgi:hypothetical protein